MRTQLPEWQALQAHYQKIKEKKMRDWFAEDAQRFSRFSVRLDDILFDYSKNRITAETLKLFCDLALACALPAKIQALFAGADVNTTESRPALHVALRHQAKTPIVVAGQDVMPKVHDALEKMAQWIKALREGSLRGATGKSFRDVVNIGIGGSHLGPRMMTHAFSSQASGSLRFYFISDIDGFALEEVLQQIDPERTLFIISSKSFSTLETMVSAKACLAWLKAKLSVPPFSVRAEKILQTHFVAVTAQQDKALQFGIPEEKIFSFWDWVGGRYSLWSAIGLPLALQLGMDGFKEFLAGAYAADQHFLTAELSRNIPVLMGLLGIWYLNFFDAHTQAIIPYDYRLKYLRAYLQQLDMESNGKRVTHAGHEVSYATGPIIWGELGMHGQHAFHQLLHQGTHMVPVDFILVGQANRTEERGVFSASQDLLIANALCQAGALMNGREISTDGSADTERLAQHKAIPGNRPSNMLFLEKLTPRSLGTLLALYEHKVFVQSVIWDINPFDQWGVELGKTMLSSVLEDIYENKIKHRHDASTENLILHYKNVSDSY